MTTPFADASVDVVANFDHFDPQFTRKLRSSVTESATATEAPLRRMSGNVNRVAFSLAKLAGSFALVVGKAILAAAAAGVFGLAAAALAVQAFALAGALTPIGGLVAALPAVLAGAALSAGTLMLAMQGLDAVVKALAKGDLDDFNKALKNLSPNARAFAGELRTLKPHLDSLRFGVQDRAFAGLSTTLDRMAKSLFPTVRRGLGGLATDFNITARSVAGFFTTRAARSDLAQVLESARVSAASLGRAVAPLAKALLGTMVAAGPAVQRITSLISAAAGRFAVWVTSARQSGLLTRTLNEAMRAARLFGGVLADAGGIIRSVFTAGAGAAGGNMLANLRAITAQVRAFLASASGQDTLTAIFTAIRDAGGPMLALLKQATAVIVTDLIPIVTDLATSAGPGLRDMITGLGDGLRALIPAAGPVGNALSAIGTALGPLLARSGEALAGTLVPLAENLARIIPALVPAILQMLSATSGTNTTMEAAAPNTLLFTQAVQYLADHLETVRKVFPYVIGAFVAYKAAQTAANTAALLSIPVRIAEIVTTRAHTAAMRAQVAAAVTATGAENAGVVARIRGRIAELGAAAATGARTAALWLYAAASRAATTISAVFAAITSAQNIRDAASAVVLGVKTGALWLWTAAQSAASIAAGVWTAAQWALNIAMDANPIGLIILAIAALVGVIILAYNHSATFRNIVQSLGAGFVQLWQWIVEGAPLIWHWIQVAFAFTPLGAFIAGIRLVITHWTQIRDAIGAGADAIAGFFSRLGARVLNFVLFYMTLPARIASALAGFADAIAGNIAQAWDQAVETTDNRFDAVIAFVFGIRQRVLDALAGAGDWLASIGRNIIDGLIGGVKGKLEDAKKAFTGLADSVPAWMRKALGIKSPSTVMYEVGKNVVDGYADGITAGQAKVEAAALRLQLATLRGMGPSANAVEHGLDMARAAAAAVSGSANAIEERDRRARAAAATNETADLQRRIAALDKISAGHGIKVPGQPADAGTGLGGTAGIGLTSTDEQKAKDKAKALADKAAAAAERHRVAMEAAGKFLGDGLIKGLTSSEGGIKSAADRMAGLLTTAIGRGKASPLVAQLQADSLRLRALAAERDTAAKQLTEAQKKLADLVATSNKLRDDIAGKVRSSFQLIPQTGTTTIQALLDSMSRAVKQAAGFAADIARLSARGLAKPLLAQLAEAGPVAGAAMAAQLAKASGTQLTQLNAMSVRLEAAATATGSTVADAMYKSGIQAAQGLVDGLKAKHKDLEDTMLAIAKSIQGAIRKALGIRSPSTVMRGLGEEIGAGLAQGILASVPPVRAAMAVMAAEATIPAVPARPAAPGAAIPAQRGAAAPGPATPGGAPTHGTAPLIGTMNLNLPTGDAEAAAQTVVNRLAVAVGT